jgi:hypothetical protein
MDARHARRRIARARAQLRNLDLLLTAADNYLRTATRYESPDASQALCHGLRVLDQVQVKATCVGDEVTHARDAARRAMGRGVGLYQRGKDG